MKIEQKVTSLELSKNLEQAGATQKSQYKWAALDGVKGKREILTFHILPVKGEWFSGFDCAELLERLPAMILHKDGSGVKDLSLQKLADEAGTEMFTAGYSSPVGDHDLPYMEDDMHEALGKLYLWGLETGYIKEEG